MRGGFWRDICVRGNHGTAEQNKKQFWQTANRLSLVACLLFSGVLNAQETAAKKAATKPEKIQAVSSNGAVPVPYAVIVNKNTGVQVMTDEAGNATIQRNVQLDTLLLRSVGFMDMVIYPDRPSPIKCAWWRT